jgi:hypothetical protein
MPDWLMIVLLAGTRALYSAAVEALITYGLFSILPECFRLGYLTYFIFWYVIGFIVAYIRINRFFKN